MEKMLSSFLFNKPHGKHCRVSYLRDKMCIASSLSFFFCKLGLWKPTLQGFHHQIYLWVSAMLAGDKVSLHVLPSSVLEKKSSEGRKLTFSGVSLVKNLVDKDESLCSFGSWARLNKFCVLRTQGRTAFLYKISQKKKNCIWSGSFHKCIDSVGVILRGRRRGIHISSTGQELRIKIIRNNSC